MRSSSRTRPSSSAAARSPKPSQRRLRTSSIATLLLLIDQFEETYALCDKDDPRALGAQGAFIANLLDAASDPGRRLAVVITMRSDFFGETQRHPPLNHAIAERHLLVPAMSGSD